MKSFKIFTTICMMLFSIMGIAQNVGINNTNPQASLDVQGDLRLRSAVLNLPVGLNGDVDLITTKSSVYMFGGAALGVGGCQITGFTGGIDGRMITIFNNSVNGAMQLYDASNGISIANSAAANRIITGTGNSAIIYGNGSVTLRYDGAKASWIVTGSNYVDGLSTVAASQWNVAGNNISNNNSGNVGIGIAAPTSKLDVLTSTANTIAIGGVNSAGGYGVYGRSLEGGFGVLGEAFGANATGGYFLTNGAFPNETALKGETLGGGTAAYFNAPGVGGKAIIVNDGNVGIGEPNPIEKLHVKGGNVKIGANALWTSAADDKVLKFGDGAFVGIGEVGGDDLMEIKANKITMAISSSNSVSIPSGSLSIGASPLETTSPLSFKNDLGKKISLWSNGTNSEFGFGIQSGTLQIYTPGQDLIGFGYGSSNDFTRTMAFYTGSGQLAINGLPSPSYHLTVNGKIRTKEVVVESGWADYVFAKDYKLPSLTDVEKYIKANNHLPEIPSAKEIQENGLKVGEVQTKMMQKIEELTLYVIEQSKTIITMQKKLEALENK